tara:strand:+ start:495 stop:1352 length:858 start_codon:yes stop_codon:yes gene_type:complete
MKITKSQIKKIIQEEIQGLLSEKALRIVKGIPKPRDIYRSTRDYENAVRYLTVLGLGSDHPSFDHPHRNLDDLDDMERRYTYDPPEKPKMRYAKIRNFDLGGDKGLDDASVQDMVAQLAQQTLDRSDRSPNMQRQIASPVSPTSRPHGEKLEESEKLKLAKLRKIMRDEEAKKATGRDRSAKEMAGSLVGKTLTEVEPIPRRDVPAVNMLPFELEKNASETRSEEQVNETDRFKQALKTAKNVRPNTPEERQSKENERISKKISDRLKRAVNKKNRRFARQPAKK